MPVILQYPENPDQIARLAGKSIYDTSVGLLRRAELYRLGNAWGAKFPVGATKDYMLPFFKDLEAKGVNPLRPPTEKSLDALVKERSCEFDGTNHAEVAPPEEQNVNSSVFVPPPKSEFETKLEGLHMGDIRKMCKLRGILQTNKDRKQDLIARIIAASEGNDLEQDIPSGC